MGVRQGIWRCRYCFRPDSAGSWEPSAIYSLAPMPNGTDLTPDEFAELEMPLRRIEATLQRFAAQVGGRLQRNYHGQPSRDLVSLGSDGISRKIQISPYRPEPVTDSQRPRYRYLFAVMAWKGSGARRLFWEKTVFTSD